MTQKMKITFLGTSDAVPSVKRNHTSILLSYGSENILFDCGEGTQRQIRQAGLNLCSINRLLITHWHGDHVLGIPGLLQTLAFSGYNKTLFIYGPKGTKVFMQEMFRTFVFFGKISLKVIEVDNEKFLEEKDFYIETKPMTHGTPCNAYTFVKKNQVRIDKQKLKKSKLPLGPLIKNLKEGKNVTYEGKTYKSKDLIFTEEGKKVSIVLDTNLNDKIIPFVKESDLLVIESNFDAESHERAKEYHHLTSKQTAEIAKKAKVKKLILTHISQRYDKNPEKILNEAKKIFKNTTLAKDLEVVEI
jgi:ribonuclease Z